MHRWRLHWAHLTIMMWQQASHGRLGWENDASVLSSWYDAIGQLCVFTSNVAHTLARRIGLVSHAFEPYPYIGNTNDVAGAELSALLTVKRELTGAPFPGI